VRNKQQKTTKPKHAADTRPKILRSLRVKKKSKTSPKPTEKPKPFTVKLLQMRLSARSAARLLKLLIVMPSGNAVLGAGMRLYEPAHCDVCLAFADTINDSAHLIRKTVERRDTHADCATLRIVLPLGDNLDIPLCVCEPARCDLYLALADAMGKSAGLIRKAVAHHQEYVKRHPEYAYPDLPKYDLFDLTGETARHDLDTDHAPAMGRCRPVGRGAATAGGSRTISRSPLHVS